VILGGVRLSFEIWLVWEKKQLPGSSGPGTIRKPKPPPISHCAKSHNAQSKAKVNRRKKKLTDVREIIVNRRENKDNKCDQKN